MLRFAKRRIQSFIISVADKIEVMFLSYTLLHFQYVTQKTLKISDQPVCLFRNGAPATPWENNYVCGWGFISFYRNCSNCVFCHVRNSVFSHFSCCHYVWYRINLFQDYWELAFTYTISIGICQLNYVSEFSWKLLEYFSFL